VQRHGRSGLVPEQIPPCRHTSPSSAAESHVSITSLISHLTPEYPSGQSHAEDPHVPPLAQKKPAPAAHRVIVSAHCGPVKSSRHWHTRSGFSWAAPVLHAPSFKHCEGRVTHARVSFGSLGTRKGQAFVRSCARVVPASRVRRIPTGQGWKRKVQRVAEGTHPVFCEIAFAVDAGVPLSAVQVNIAAARRRGRGERYREQRREQRQASRHRA
jgi:hypothetical protein